MSDVFHQPADVPAGFAPMPMGGPFVAANGPMYVYDQGGAIKLGMRIDQRQCNSIGIVHGGWMATFADMMMPVVFMRHPEVAVRNRALPTVSLQIDFIGATPMGAWLEGDAQVLKVTRSLVFAQGVARADGKIVLRASGVYKFGPEFAGDKGMFTDGTDAAKPKGG
jgi:uncharacterized protein (TIGR00369 family)